jgi:hypothetical protein
MGGGDAHSISSLQQMSRDSADGHAGFGSNSCLKLPDRQQGEAQSAVHHPLQDPLRCMVTLQTSTSIHSWRFDLLDIKGFILIAVP